MVFLEDKHRDHNTTYNGSSVSFKKTEWSFILFVMLHSKRNIGMYNKSESEIYSN